MGAFCSGMQRACYHHSMYSSFYYIIIQRGVFEVHNFVFMYHFCSSPECIISFRAPCFLEVDFNFCIINMAFISSAGRR